MVNKSLFVFIALMVCVASLCAQPIYRCGNTFQQTPCDEKGGEVITFKEAFNSYGRSAQRAGSKSVQGLNEAAFNSFYLKNMPAVGMTAQQLAKILGAPVQESSRQVKGVVHQQQMYEKDGRRMHVQLKDGVATSIAYRAAGKAAKGKNRSQTAHSCPTELEIRNAKVSANSLTLSPKERAKRQRAIEKMERCGQK